jgi:hypothetical protein
MLGSDPTFFAYHDGQTTMGLVKRGLASVLLATGIVLVFSGLSKALGFTPAGMLASVAVIATLLYAGGLWFGGSNAQLAAAGATTVIVFDRFLSVVSGAPAGASLLAQFPKPLRPELEARCQMALRGQHTSFSCEHRGVRLSFDISPVQTVSGVVIYGVLVAGQGQPLPALAAEPLTTVA